MCKFGNMRVTLISIIAFVTGMMISSCSGGDNNPLPDKLSMSHEKLMDKIKGGWAGQTIGVSYGAPTEFKYQQKMIPDSVIIPWGNSDCIKKIMTNEPGIYDDIYMDLTFVEVFDRLGIHAPVDSLAYAFAYADYDLCEANQTARFNILNGIMPPASGYWRNNPHANDIDFQIEADFAGLMSPGMPNTAAVICDSVGHIMNYGDGWYGGVYMATMYSLAFVSDSIEFVVTEALKCIPEESNYYRCISDIINTYHNNPDDWKVAWQRCADKWDNDISCPTGAMKTFNIDASLNSAYVVIGLLYGNGDFGKTIDIATRCGQDSDCNPASAGGILGTMLGYSNMPEEWISPLKTAEDIKFSYTTSSLNDTYRMSFEQALAVIKDNGGKVTDSEVIIKCQRPVPVAFEQSFDNLKPVKLDYLWKALNDGDYEGTLTGNAVVFSSDIEGERNNGYVAEVEVSIDGNIMEIVKIPANFTIRKNDLYWNYDLDGKEHKIVLRLLNPCKESKVMIYSMVQLAKDTVSEETATN